MIVATLGLALGLTNPPPALERPHPRLLLDPPRIAALQPKLVTSHRFLWDRYLQDLPHMLAVARREAPLEDERYAGDLIAELAFAFLMTGRHELGDVATAQLLHLVTDEQWGTDEGLVYLVPAHYITGIALGYDWLYARLTPAERARVAERLGREAELQYTRITVERAWWRNQYVQNHSHSNTAALAFAAAALWGEDPRAPLWLATAEAFFDKSFAVLPRDGSSLEGYAYAGYGGEYILNYALLGRDLLGKHDTEQPWLVHFPEYLLQGLLPFRTPEDWAMTFGDAPRRGWTSTAQQLFTLAALHHDAAAQWMALQTVALRPTGLGSHGWMMLLGYDATLAPADPATFPTFARFPEIDQAMMRSSWTDPDATLIGFKCGPFLGHTLSAGAPFDYGTGHQDADSGSFQLFSHGQFLSIDPGYTGQERTEDHSTLLFKGHGQLGEQAAFGSSEALRFGHHPEIVHSETSAAYDYVVGDVTRAYHPALGVERFVRHLLFVKPDVLVVADEIALRPKGVVVDLQPHELETSRGLRHASNGYVVGTEGDAFFVFEGVPGTYRIAAVYLDNVPEAGRYSFRVDGRTVHAFRSGNEGRDDNLIEVSGDVVLKRGSRVAFHAAPMSPGTRLTKLSVFSATAPSPMSAEWLLHLDPRAAVVQQTDGLEATLDAATLELHRLLADGSRLEWGSHAVAKPEVEPFTFRTTTRVRLRPRLVDGRGRVLTLLRGRRVTAARLADVSAEEGDDGLRIGFTREGRRIAVVWNIEKRSVALAP
jgi:Heparinase II/III-like protein